MFVAFLGIARPWNYSTPMRDLLEVAAVLYVVAQIGVFTILATAARKVDPASRGWADRVARSLAAFGSLGHGDLVPGVLRVSSKRRKSVEEPAGKSLPATSLPAGSEPPVPALRPALRLVGGRSAADQARHAAR